MFLLTLVVFILVLGILVFVHELGHFVAARRVGIKVEEFAIGMGPKVWGYVKDGIHFNLRALPIGGWVKMYGEGDYDLTDKDSFGGKKPSLRMIVLVAGVFMNIVLAVFIFFLQGVFTSFSYPVLEGNFTSNYQTWVGNQSQDYIAISEYGVSDTSSIKGELDGIEVVTRVNGENYQIESFRDIVEENKGQPLNLELRGLYNDETRSLEVVPRVEYPENEGPIGVRTITVSYVEYEGIGVLFSGFGQVINTVQSFGAGMSILIDRAQEEQSIAPVAEGVGGAVSIFTILQSMITDYGFLGILVLMALFSVNLAIINILPIPALDGGHVLFTLMEIITRKRLPTTIYNYLTIGGFILLMSFMLLITFVDVVRHTPAGDFFCEDRRLLGFVCDLSGERSR